MPEGDLNEAGREPNAAERGLGTTDSTAPWGTCSRCQSPLTRPAAAGGCLQCIVDFVTRDEDFSGSAGAAGNEEVRGYSHFEIMLTTDGALAELGHGAMGTTYRAVDTVLRTPVALKVIGRNVADSAAVRSRFLREARSAAKLRHPNVASVFHYGEQEGECFYVMELVEGETLEARVSRDGPLPVQTVLQIALQVAHALLAAEAQHLVHRDIKPGNLMWVATTREDKPGDPPLIKVIDFGLAKALTGEPEAAGESDTRHGFAGTPAYASPEQFARSPEHPVDTRSDLYSLGVTLWYLLCGRTPFRGATLEEIQRQQSGQALPLDQLVARRVPPQVTALLRSLLAVDPRQRPQSVREFIELLEGCQTALSPAGRSRSRRVWTTTLLLLTCGGLATLLLFAARRGTGKSSPPPPTMDRSLAILPFENRSPDPAETFLAVATQDALTKDLARVREIKVIGSDSTRTYQPGKRDLPQIGRELGVQFILEGDVRRENGDTQVSTRLVNAGNGTQLWAKHYRDASADTYSIYREITLEVASRLQAALTSGERAAINRRPTTDPSAYDIYLRVRADPDTSVDQVTWCDVQLKRAALLEEAVTRDPRFTLAYCELAGVYADVSFRRASLPPERRAVDYRRLAQAALQHAWDSDPDAGEVHLARAGYFLLAEHDIERAGIEVELARHTLPNSAGVEFLAGRVARRQGRWEDAVRSLERASALEPRNDDILGILRETYQAMRRYADFDRTELRMVAVGPAPEAGKEYLYGTTGALEGKADLGPLLRIRAARPADDSPGEITKEYTDLLITVLSHDPDALLHVLATSGRDPVGIAGTNYPNAFFEGLAARMRGDATGARTAFARARPEVEKAVLEEPEDGRPLSLLALIDAGQGRNEDAVREARHACELLMPYEKFALEAPAARSALATVYAWTGQPDLAFAELNAIVDGPAGSAFLIEQPTYGDFCLNPYWDPIRNDPRFAALVKKLAPQTTQYVLPKRL